MDEQTSNIQQKPYNLAPNVEAALSYLISPFTGIAVILMEKQNKFVRFHAFQSIFFGIAAFVLMTVFGAIPVIGWVVAAILPVGFVILWLLLMWKAYNNVEYELPFIGKLAKDQANK